MPHSRICFGTLSTLVLCLQSGPAILARRGYFSLWTFRHVLFRRGPYSSHLFEYSKQAPPLPCGESPFDSYLGCFGERTNGDPWKTVNRAHLQGPQGSVSKKGPPNRAKAERHPDSSSLKLLSQHLDLGSREPFPTTIRSILVACFWILGKLLAFVVLVRSSKPSI